MSSSVKFFKTKEFEKLNKKWKKKLKKSGFEDIEPHEATLTDYSFRFSRQKSLDNYKFKEAYFTMATHLLNDYTFDTNLERIIWEYHAEGISIRNISKLLKKVKIKQNPSQVYGIVKNLQTIMFNLYNNGSNE